jgi:hypothetical protein
MDQLSIEKLLKDLREELKNIQEAIHALERLSAGMGARRGRPPLWLSEARQRKRKEHAVIADRALPRLLEKPDRVEDSV